MTDSQRNRIAPHWAAIELFHKSGQSVLGNDALKELQAVNSELGNAPVCLTCPAGIAELLRLTYNNYVNGR